MSDLASTSPAQNFRPLRLWPAVALVLMMVVLRALQTLIQEPPIPIIMAAMMGPLVASGLILIWWLFASRATWIERLAGFGAVLAAFFITAGLADPTMKGPGFMVLTIPMGIGAFAVGAILLRRTLSFRRTGIAIILAVVAFSFSLLLRNSGMTGDYALDFHWRWQSTPEEELLADKLNSKTLSENIPADNNALTQALANPEWPAFRGPHRLGISTAPTISTDWEKFPPALLWKIPIGPAWSSFVVAGNFLFTQEQRGPAETVVCYDANSGREIWTREIESRFDEPLGGPGPRATPTLANNALFALGAEGWLMRLDPTSGDITWKQDLRTIADREPPMWGFSSSPLVTNSAVIVHAGGADDKGTLAFDINTGDLLWSAPSGDHSYASPQLATILDTEYILMPSNKGMELLDPESGTVAFAHEWPSRGYRVLQPQVIDQKSVILASTDNLGTQRIDFSKEGDNLSGTEQWTSLRLKPDFNDFVIHNDHAYGFDASIFTCIDLATGERKWKGGRYGKGQVLLLENSGLLLVAGEQGEVVLLKATPEAHTELARFEALEGKTWNHPVVVGDKLYLRNAQEAAAYKLPLDKQTPGSD
ncbi:MAG: PQQ-binding-like beta-propeller repeat protein [Verrucomicrobiota bacterium]